MIVTLSVVIIITILSYFYYKQIHKYKYILYALSAIIALISHEEGNFITYGFIPLSFFLVVMYSGVLDKSTIRKRLFMVRAELAIIGSILITPHVFSFLEFIIEEYGIFGAPLYFYIGLLVAIIIVPLFITSFPQIRKIFTYKEWKKLHKLSYPLYLLIGLHLILINNERQIYYIVIFGTYIFFKTIMIMQSQFRKRHRYLKKNNIS